MKNSWLFPDAPQTVVFTTRNVVEEGAPILIVTHDQGDGAWQFRPAAAPAAAEGRIVSLQEMVFNDPSLFELADLPMGWRAVRDSINSPWRRHPIMFTITAVGQHRDRQQERQSDFPAEESMACVMVEER
jgi:hypothetical protein